MKPFTSLVFKNQAEQDAAYAPKIVPTIGRTAGVKPVAVFEEPTKAQAGDDELRLHGFKAGKKGLCTVCFKTMDDGPHTTEELPKPKGRPKAALHKVVAILEAARFRYARTESLGIKTAHGYVHANGCGAVYIEDAKGEGESWTVRDPAGNESSGKAGNLVGLEAALDRPVKKAPVEPKAARLTELAAKIAAKKPVPSLAELASAPKPPHGPPTNVMRAVEILGGFTTMRFDLDMLKGDKNYGRRMKLMKVLLAKDKVLVAETGVGAMAKAFHEAVGATGHPHPKTRAAEFAAKCKEIAVIARKIKADAKAAEREAIRRGKLGADYLERFVAGKILDAPPKKLSKAERKAVDDSIVEDILKFSVSTEHYAQPNPNADVTLVPGDVGLLRDPDNGIVMLQLERENSQGAIAVYSNGVRVAAGVIPLATLRTLRPVAGEVDLVLAAQQLLRPPTPGMPVTPAAARHLQAILDCKEFNEMATKKAPKKFEAQKPAKKAAAVTATKKAEKTESTPRKACTYRLLTAAKKTWEAFGGQKGQIVGALVKAGAVGAKTVGLTASAITEATGIGPKNVAFYMSKLQKTDPAVLEKLAAA